MRRVLSKTGYLTLLLSSLFLSQAHAVNLETAYLSAQSLSLIHISEPTRPY